MTANQPVPNGLAAGNISRANSQVTLDSTFNPKAGATSASTSTATSHSTKIKSSTVREPYDLKKSREYYHFLFGALLSYVIIGLWVWSTARFMIEIQKLEKGPATELLSTKMRPSQPSATTNAMTSSRVRSALFTTSPSAYFQLSSFTSLEIKRQGMGVVYTASFRTSSTATKMM